jgi:hypothetical protein
LDEAERRSRDIVGYDAEAAEADPAQAVVDVIRAWGQRNR